MDQPLHTPLVEETSSSNSSKTTLPIIVTFLVTAVLIGGGVYMWQKSMYVKQQTLLQQQITTLQQQVTQLHQPTPSSASILPNTQAKILTPSPSDSVLMGFKSFSSPELGLTFSYPSTYAVVSNAEKQNITFNDSQISMTEVVLHAGEIPEGPQIRVDRTQDPKVIAYASMDHALVSSVINGIRWQAFTWDGLGDTVGYVTKQGEFYYMVTFNFAPDLSIVDQVMKSIQFN